MSKQPESDYPKRTRQHLREIVTDAAGQPPLWTDLDMREVGPNAEAHLLVRWRGDPRYPSPDECERAILELLYRRGRTRVKDVVLQLLEQWSERTILRRLDNLAYHGLVRNRAKAPRGYDLDPSLRTRADACGQADSA